MGLIIEELSQRPGAHCFAGNEIGERPGVDGAKTEISFRGAALENLPERQIIALHDVITNHHVGSVERGRGYKAVFRRGAQTELFGGSFIVADIEAVRDTGAIHDVVGENA
jgi:hypothetical protein